MQVIRPKVLTNLVPFLKVSFTSLGEKDQYMVPWDNCRIHLDHYKIADKIIKDAYENTDANAKQPKKLETKFGKPDSYRMHLEILQSPNKLKTLDIDA